MAGETLLQTFFTRLGFQTDTSGLDEYKDKLVDLSSSLLKLSGVATLSLGGLFEFTRRATQPMAELAKMSETYGIATTTLAAFGRMGREVGVSTEAMTQGIAELSRKMGEVASPAAARLRKLTEGYGLSVQKAGGDVRVFLGDVAERMKTLSAQEQVNLVTKMGLDPAAVRMLRNGREEFLKMYDAASKGLPFKEEDYAKAERFQIEFQKARAALGVLSSQVALTLMPAFQKAMEAFLTWWRANGERVMERIKYWVKMFADWLENLFTFMGRMAKETDLVSIAMKLLGTAVGILVAAKLSSWIMTAVNAFVKLAGAQALATWQLWLIVAVIAVIIGLVLLLIDDFETWKKSGESVIGNLVAYFKNAEGAMGKVRDVAKWVWEQLKSYWAWMAESWAEAWAQMKKTFAAWWPAIKVGLKVVGAVLLVAIAIVAALALGLAVLVAKIVTWLGKISEFFAAIFTGDFGKAKDMLAALGDYLWSLIDKAGEWLRTMSGKAEAAIKAWFSSILDKLNAWLTDIVGRGEAAIVGWFKSMVEAAVTWINEMISTIAGWIKTGSTAIFDAFVGIFKNAITAVRAIFQAFWDEWIGKIVGIAEKVKGVFGKSSPAVGAMAGGEAPPIIPMAGATGPMIGSVGKTPFVNVHDAGNLTQNNTFNVGTMDEATEGARKLQEEAKKNAAANALAMAGATVF